MSARSKKRAIKSRSKRNALRKWDDSFYIVVYDMVREGCSMSETASALGVNLNTLKKWKRQKPVLRDIIDRALGRTNGKGKAQPETFGEYVFKRLPPSLQELWNKLCDYEKEKNPLQRIQMLLADHGEQTLKHLFIHALIVGRFNASEACRRLNITKQKFESWCSGDPNFADMIDEVLWHKKNFVEGSLMQLIAAGDSAAVIFASKTLNKDRGYNPKMELDINGGITHQVSLDELDLPVEDLRRIMAAVRSRMIEGKLENGRIEPLQLPAPAEEDE